QARRVGHKHRSVTIRVIRGPLIRGCPCDPWPVSPLVLLRAMRYFALVLSIVFWYGDTRDGGSDAGARSRRRPADPSATPTAAAGMVAADVVRRMRAAGERTRRRARADRDAARAPRVRLRRRRPHAATPRESQPAV